MTEFGYSSEYTFLIGLVTVSKKTKTELEKLGVIIDDEYDFDESNLFYNEKAIIKGTDNKL